MQQAKLKITYTGLFGMAVFILLVSRILVLTGNYNWPIDPVTLQMMYLFVAVAIVTASNRGRLTVQKGHYLTVLTILLVHTLLWGVVFVDQRMAALITSQFKSQIMFVVVLFVTIWAITQLGAERLFLQCAYFALTLVLCIQLVTNFSDVNLSNLANIFSAHNRTRANFGFGHYNALGAACISVIMLREFLCKQQSRTLLQKILDILILVMAVVMLLCSASRSAITGLLLYYVMYFSTRLDYWQVSSTTIRVLKVIRVFVVLLLGIWALVGFDMEGFLVASQRAMLFSHTLPMFFKTGNVLFGLGYASNTAYASGKTPYTTFWMDNAYAYYLVATGVVGLVLIMIALLVMFGNLYRKRKSVEGAVVFAAFIVYAYTSLFETTLFNSGGLVNYIYLPWFLISAAREKKGVVRNENRNEPQGGPFT